MEKRRRQLPSQKHLQGRAISAVCIFASLALCVTGKAYQVTLEPGVKGRQVWQDHGLGVGEARAPFRGRNSYLLVLTDPAKNRLAKDSRVASVLSLAPAGENDARMTRGGGAATDRGRWKDRSLAEKCDTEGKMGPLAGTAECAQGGGEILLQVVAARFFDEKADPAASVVQQIEQKLDIENTHNECPIRMTFEVKEALRIFEVRVPEADLCRCVDFLMASEGVAFAERKEIMSLRNNYAAATGQSGASAGVSRETAVIWREGLMGQGEVVGVGDTGLDIDSCYFREGRQDIQGAGEELKGCDLARHKVVCYFKGEESSFGDEETSNGHGTHVAGTIAGLHNKVLEGNDNWTVSFNDIIENSDYSNGMAPLARLSINDINGEIPGTVDPPVDMGVSTFFEEPYNDAAVRIHANSWGCSRSDGLDRECNKYDSVTRGIDEFIWNNKDFLVVIAAGNSGAIAKVDQIAGRTFENGFFTVGEPATLKNGLSVGATKRTNAPDDYCKIGQRECTTDDLFDSSSRGPTFDGRIKPDIVFPGENILSAESSGDPTDFSEGTCHTAIPTMGVKLSSGTSMACPGIAGTAALIRQYYREFDPATGLRSNPLTGPLLDGKGPSAALIKATLINSARGLTGLHRYTRANGTVTTQPFDAQPNPLYLYGFGLPALNNTLAFAGTGARLFVFDRYALSEDGQKHKFQISVSRGGSLKATLVYTDPPGPVTSAFEDTEVLVNDLDLSASCQSQTCNDTFLDNKWKSQSRVDNVEQVPSVGLSPHVFGSEMTISLEVTAVNLEQSQPYSLVIAGKGLTLIEGNSERPNWIPDWGTKARATNSLAVLAIGGWQRIAILGVAGFVLFAIFLTLVKKVVTRVRSKKIETAPNEDAALEAKDDSEHEFGDDSPRSSSKRDSSQTLSFSSSP